MFVSKGLAVLSICLMAKCVLAQRLALGPLATPLGQIGKAAGLTSKQNTTGLTTAASSQTKPSGSGGGGSSLESLLENLLSSLLGGSSPALSNLVSTVVKLLKSLLGGGGGGLGALLRNLLQSLLGGLGGTKGAAGSTAAKETAAPPQTRPSLPPSACSPRWYLGCEPWHRDWPFLHHAFITGRYYGGYQGPSSYNAWRDHYNRMMTGMSSNAHQPMTPVVPSQHKPMFPMMSRPVQQPMVPAMSTPQQPVSPIVYMWFLDGMPEL